MQATHSANVLFITEVYTRFTQTALSRFGQICLPSTAFQTYFKGRTACSQGWQTNVTGVEFDTTHIFVVV
jgi:hypothetical protein